MSPVRATPTRVAAPPIVPGGRIDLVSMAPSPSPTRTVVNRQAAAPETWYIVYHGRNGTQGLFNSWKGGEDSVGPKDLCQGYEHRLFRKFDDQQKAEMYWEELNESGVLDLLRDVPQRDEVFIVIKRVEPGVYTNRYVPILRAVVCF